MESNDERKSYFKLTSDYLHQSKQAHTMTYRGAGRSADINFPPYRQCDDNGDLTEDQEIQVFAKQMLVNRLFMGHYQERRLVDSLRSYRDVVMISNSEYRLKTDLDIVRRRVKSHPLFSKTWVGITGPEMVGAPAGQAIWVKLRELPFGQYWFQIKQVKFVDDKEMYLRLKCVRPVDVGSLNDRGDFDPVRASQIPDSTSESGTETIQSEVSVDWERVKHKLKASLEEGTENLFSVMTLHNAKEVICFIAVLLAACVTGLLHSVRYLGDYSLRFMREFSYIIRATTPIFLAIIDFFSKVVGGFYLLIAMMWRSSRQPQPMPRSFQTFIPPPRPIEMPRNWQRR